MNKSSSKPETLILETKVYTPNENDVLLGRGSCSNRNEGNYRFRELIRDHLDTYISKRDHQSKAIIAKYIVQTINERGGRFFKKIKPGRGVSVIVPVDDKDVIYEKVKQAFRNAAKSDDYEILTKKTLYVPAPSASTSPSTLAKVATRNEKVPEVDHRQKSLLAAAAAAHDRVVFRRDDDVIAEMKRCSPVVSQQEKDRQRIIQHYGNMTTNIIRSSLPPVGAAAAASAVNRQECLEDATTSSMNFSLDKLHQQQHQQDTGSTVLLKDHINDDMKRLAVMSLCPQQFNSSSQLATLLALRNYNNNSINNELTSNSSTNLLTSQLLTNNQGIITNDTNALLEQQQQSDHHQQLVLLATMSGLMNQHHQLY